MKAASSSRRASSSEHTSRRSASASAVSASNSSWGGGAPRDPAPRPPAAAASSSVARWCPCASALNMHRPSPAMRCTQNTSPGVPSSRAARSGAAARQCAAGNGCHPHAAAAAVDTASVAALPTEAAGRAAGRGAPHASCRRAPGGWAGERTGRLSDGATRAPRALSPPSPDAAAVGKGRGWRAAASAVRATIAVRHARMAADERVPCVPAARGCCTGVTMERLGRAERRQRSAKRRGAATQHATLARRQHPRAQCELHTSSSSSGSSMRSPLSPPPPTRWLRRAPPAPRPARAAARRLAAAPPRSTRSGCPWRQARRPLACAQLHVCVEGGRCMHGWGV